MTADLEPWDSWEGGDQSSKQQTQSRNYQQIRQQQLQQQEEEPEPDYFESMTPKFKKQTKVSWFLAKEYIPMYWLTALKPKPAEDKLWLG